MEEEWSAQCVCICLVCLCIALCSNSCDDYLSVCPPDSCSTIGCGTFNPLFPCACNTFCVQFNDW